MQFKNTFFWGLILTIGLLLSLILESISAEWYGAQPLVVVPLLYLCITQWAPHLALLSIATSCVLAGSFVWYNSIVPGIALALGAPLLFKGAASFIHSKYLSACCVLTMSTLAQDYLLFGKKFLYLRYLPYTVCHLVVTLSVGIFIIWISGRRDNRSW